MVAPGHFAGGYLLTKTVLYAWHLSLTPHQYDVAMAVGLICSNAPDLDLFYFFKKRNSALLAEDESHRDLASHAPIIWLIIGALVYLSSSTDYGRAIAVALVAGSWSHFILDSIEYGIMWLWPFHKKRFALRQVKQKEPVEKNIWKFYWRLLWEVYVHNWTFWLEITLVATALIVYFRG